VTGDLLVVKKSSENQSTAMGLEGGKWRKKRGDFYAAIIKSYLPREVLVNGVELGWGGFKINLGGSEDTY